MVSGRRCLTEWLWGTWRVRPLRSRGWLSQELRVALWDRSAKMRPLRSEDSSEEARQGIDSLQRALPSPTESLRESGWCRVLPSQGLWLPCQSLDPLFRGPTYVSHTSFARSPPRSPAGDHRGWARLGFPLVGAALQGRACLPSLPTLLEGSLRPRCSSLALWADTAAGARRGFPAAGHGFLAPRFAAASPGTPGRGGG